MYKKFFFLFIFLILISFFAVKSLKPTIPEGTILSPLARSFFKSDLEEIIKNQLKDAKGEYAVYIKNFKTNEVYELNSHKSYEPASLYKLWVMAAVYQKIKEGSLSQDELLKSDIKNLNEIFDISSESAELTEGSIELTVSKAVNQMITISHNYAALLLVERIRKSNVEKLMREYELSESGLGKSLKTTASDMGKFYELLYKGEIIDSKSSEEMISLLSKQQLNDRIPKLLPIGLKVAHKTGEIDFYKHDAGLVFTPKGDYVIVLLSKSSSPKGAAEREALISKAVYDYFQD